MTNYLRSFRLMRDSIKRLDLDLSGIIVLTEAASGNYVYTPLMAALANAKRVYAITRDSKYGKAQDIIKNTYQLAKLLHVEKKIEISQIKSPDIIKQADIITNLGFVRPIDRQMIEMMKPTANIPLMWESWEYRKGDIDLDACREKGIIVMGTDEEHPNLNVFTFSGILCIKMLFELGVEVYKSKIIILSGDKFGDVIKRHLDALGAEVYLIDNLKSTDNRRHIENSDALVVAYYASNELFIGKSGQISAEEIIYLSPDVAVVQFAGDVDIDELEHFNIRYIPKRRVGSFRMGMTLAELGPKPVIDLHCAGLKVGEVLARERANGKSIDDAKTMALKYAPAQILL